MKQETTINELAQYTGLFSTVDHITVLETDPNTGITEEVTLPPPLIRRSQRRDDTIVWILTPPGVHERIFGPDRAPATGSLQAATPTHPTGHTPQQPPAAPQQPAPAAWQQHPAYPAQQPQQAPAPQSAAPQRPPAPWANPPH
ncbi:hypothetical protein [Streptomyces luteireticuli]|uniref:hypothetical protein n=1 Tax=Streptomyces luteireticuli TaxID=173858 RepID=UPI00355609C2